MGVVVKHPTICAADYAKSDCERYEAERHPVAIETPPIHPAILGLLLPWKDGFVFKIGSLGWKNFGAFIGISRDRTHYCNRVDIDRDGNPVIHYRVQDIDIPNLLAGLEASLRMLRAAGGKMLFYAHSTAPWYVPSNLDNDEEEFEAYIQNMKAAGLKPLEMQIFSAHQMSSCRMARSPDFGPVSTTGELYECENLFVADGSVLPTSLGINPMITIDAMAHMISKNIIRKLRRLQSVGMDPIM
jgi:choline dehydrogenase-like flavoprotein